MVLTIDITTNNYQPYTYLIGWSNQNKYYYGVRFAKGCNPNEFWKKYFTSSKKVKKLRKLYGEPDIKQIRKTFKTAEQAIKWEEQVLKKLKVLEKEKWLNENVAGAIRILSFSEEHKKKISESGKGKHKSEYALKASIAASKVNLGKKRPQHSEIIKKRWKENKYQNILRKGEASPNWGLKRSDEVRQKIKSKIKTRPRACCLKCHKPLDDSIHEGLWTCHILNHHRECL